MSIRAKPKFYLLENVILDKKRKDNQFNFNFQHDFYSQADPKQAFWSKLPRKVQKFWH